MPEFFVRHGEPQLLEQAGERTFIYHYRVIPRRPGLFTLPPVTVWADEEELVTDVRVLNIGEAKTTNALRLEVHFDRREAYVGQPVVLTFSWFCALPLYDIKALDIHLPLLYHPEFEAIVPAVERTAGGQPDTIGLPVEGQRIIGALSSLKINEQSFQVITFKRILVPHKPGEYNFAPARLLCSHLPDIPARRRSVQRYPSYFDNDFFQEVGSQEAYVRYGTRSESLRLQVRALPE